MKKSTVVFTGILTLLISGVAFSDHNEDAIKYRKSAFLLMRANLGSMKRMVEGKKAFNKEQLVQHASNLVALSRMPWEHFIAGTEKGDTDAKLAIWKKAKAYRREIGKFQRASAKLLVVAKEGKNSSIKSQVRRVSKRCKSCHDDFKHK